MPTQLRKLGVHGKNIPSKKTKSVTASDFSIAGIVGFFERAFLVPFQVTGIDQQKLIFGDNINANYYGSDVAKSFWDNCNGQSGSLVIKSHVGYNGTAIDGTVASESLTDQNGLASILTIIAAIQTQYKLHIASGTRHDHADTKNTLLLSAPTCLSEAIAATNELITQYSAHEADAALGSAWAYHHGTETGSHALTSVVAVTNMATLITMLTDFKTKYNAHDSDATAHNAGTAYQVAASAPTSTPAATLQIQPAYMGNLEYGASGNRTGVKIINAVRFSTTLAAAVSANATSATLTSVAGISIGDLVVFRASGSTAAIITVKVTGKDEGNNIIYFTGPFSGGATTGLLGDTVEVPGFMIKVYRKSLTGVITEVQTDLGSTICTMEPEVIDRYVQNVFANSYYITVTTSPPSLPRSHSRRQSAKRKGPSERDRGKGGRGGIAAGSQGQTGAEAPLATARCSAAAPE